MLNELDLIIAIAETKGKISAAELAKKLKCSQQTISRKTSELFRKNLIVKGRKYFSLTEKGRELLKSYLRKIEAVLKRKKLEGTICNGFGEGAYYVKLYAKKLKKVLGFKPYYGTLNLKVDSAEKKNFLEFLECTYIEGFKKGGRTFGGVYCYKIPKKLKDIKIAILEPERNLHEDVVEIIAPVCLRRKFKFKDGEKIALEVE